MPVIRLPGVVQFALMAVGLSLGSLVDRSTTTATGVILPWVEGDFGLSVDEGTLITICYNAAFYAGILLGPWILLRFGRIRYFTWAAVTYGFAALLCATAHSFPELLVIRAVLGLAEGGFFLSALVTLFSNIPSKFAPLFILAYGAITQSATALAPLFAGSLVENNSWRDVYLILAIGALCAAICFRLSASETILDAELRGAEKSVDITGIAFLLVSASAYAYAAGYGEQRDWLNSPDVVAAFGTSLLAGLAFLAWEAYGARDPILPISIFSRRNAWLGIALGLAIGFPMYGLTELLRYLEGPLGFPLQFAGGVIALRALALVVVAPLGTFLVLRGVDSRALIAGGFTISVSAFLWQAAGTTSNSEFATFVGSQVLVGVGFGLTYSPLLTTVVSNVMFAELPFAIVMMNLFFVLSGSFANACLSTVFDHRLQKHMSDIAANVTLAHPAVAQAARSGEAMELVNVASQQATVLAFGDVALYSAAAAALAIPFALLLRPARPMPFLKNAQAPVPTTTEAG